MEVRDGLGNKAALDLDFLAVLLGSRLLYLSLRVHLNDHVDVTYAVVVMVQHLRDLRNCRLIQNLQGACAEVLLVLRWSGLGLVQLVSLCSRVALVPLN